MGNRWYDRYERFGRCLDGLKECNPWDRNRLVQGIMTIIRDHAPTLLDRFVQDFPLDIRRQRWYDKDPYLWLVMNGLRYADADLRDRVTAYLEEEYRLLAERSGAADGGRRSA